jgi:excisionase family DNA binding protein
MKTLTQEDIKAIGIEVLSVVEKCLKNINQMETINTSDLMTVDEVSVKLKLGKQTVYKLIKEQELNSIKIGKQLYVSVKNFNDYIESKY